VKSGEAGTSQSRGCHSQVQLGNERIADGYAHWGNLAASVAIR
jgi:hypothetical protein